MTPLDMCTYWDTHNFRPDSVFQKAKVKNYKTTGAANALISELFDIKIVTDIVFFNDFSGLVKSLKALMSFSSCTVFLEVKDTW